MAVAVWVPPPHVAEHSEYGDHATVYTGHSNVLHATSTGGTNKGHCSKGTT